MKIETRDLDFSGKRILVTGAASGIGREMARTFHAHGGDILAADRDRAGLVVLARECERTTQYVFDQADPDSIETLARSAGQVDVFLNNAGVVWIGAFAEMPMPEIERIITINLLGPIRLARLIGTDMLARGHGVIINTASQLAFHGAAERAVYASTKAGIAQFTRSIAAEWAAKGVRVAAIAPGRTLTNLNAHLLEDDERRAEALKSIPLGRFAEPHEMARLALLLASGVLGYVVGESVISDGGYVLL